VSRNGKFTQVANNGSASLAVGVFDELSTEEVFGSRDGSLNFKGITAVLIESTP
jgi:hypothetical protein